MSSSDNESNDRYSYSPSLPAAIIFVLAFGATTIYHAFQIMKLRSWFFIPFLIGCLLEVGGYTGRLISATETTGEWTLLPYILQALLLLLGPPFYAVSIYMVLGRLMRLLNAEQYSLIKVKWLTKFFLLGDIVSIVAQAMGGGILSGADTKKESDRGRMMILVGLGVQIAFFSLFIVASGLFHYRIHQVPTDRSEKVVAPWKTLLLVLYGASFLILVRSVFRVAEYALGEDGELMSKEVYLYIFDAIPMFFASVAFNILHPAGIIGYRGSLERPRPDSESALCMHAMEDQ